MFFCRGCGATKHSDCKRSTACYNARVKKQPAPQFKNVIPIDFGRKI